MSPILFWVCVIAVLANAQTDGFKIVEPTGYTLLQKCNQSALYRIESPAYDPPIQLIRLEGTDYQMGYDYGFLLAQEMFETFHGFMNHMLPSGMEQFLLYSFLDWQWDNYLSKNVPPEYNDEIRGITDGARDAGVVDANYYVTRVLTVANFPGDIVKNIEFLLLDEGMNISDFENLQNALKSSKWSQLKMQCSCFATWGSRTQNNQLFSMRNLDWAPDTSLAQHKLITVYHPSDPTRVPYATVGYSGFMGALTGMSSTGVSVHEMENDANIVTFLGTTWTLRLRSVLSRSKSLRDGLNIWDETLNTFGMNHMIASASDVPSGKAAVALETIKGVTAVFFDNDPREAALVVNGVQMGAGIKEAVWRTNHGFDSRIVPHELYPARPGSDSYVRYWILHDSIQYYSSVNKPIGALEAVNITSLAADKGGKHDRASFFTCPNSNIGTNVLSVTYQLSSTTMYVSFETGTKATWRTAGCGNYVKLDMTPWW